MQLCLLTYYLNRIQYWMNIRQRMHLVRGSSACFRHFWWGQTSSVHAKCWCHRFCCTTISDDVIKNATCLRTNTDAIDCINNHERSALRNFAKWKIRLICATYVVINTDIYVVFYLMRAGRQKNEKKLGRRSRNCHCISKWRMFIV